MIRSKNNFFRVSDGAHIYFEDYGSENLGNTIVILHGFLCSSKFFSKNIKELSKSNRLILVDLRGHGSSSKITNNLTIDQSAKDIKELLDFLNIDNAVLLGWSMGGSVVMSYYEQFENYRLKGLGLIDSCIYPFSDEWWNPHVCRGFNMDKMCSTMEFATYNHEIYCREFAKSILGETSSKEDENWVETEVKKTPPWIAFALYSDFIMTDYSKTLDKIKIPFFSTGVNSKLIPIGADAAKYYTTRVSVDSYFYEFKSSHMTFYEDPITFNNTVLDFLNNYID